MNNIEINKIDELFDSFNYTKSSHSNEHVRVYMLNYGMYHAVEIIKITKKYNVEDIKKEFYHHGYATEIKEYISLDELEKYLFNGFFIKTPLGNELKKRYEVFTKKQIKNLPEGSKYEYINAPYEMIEYNGGNIVKNYNSINSPISVIDLLHNKISSSDTPCLVILEAAAGFGKTCTAYEFLNKLSNEDSNQIPFFTELSRNRQARIFKHILLQEIDEQFPLGIKQNIVIQQIIKGRIPLIIDGFDELITKEYSKVDIESMLTTIVDLLKGNAKIIITSRKTALFRNDNFIDALNITDIDYNLFRVELQEPSITDWIDKNKLDVIRRHNFPIENIANPVLLAYIKNLNNDDILNLFNNNEESLVDIYLNSLLEREQERQNLKLDNLQQLKIFRKLVRLMTDLNITSESKDFIKDILKEYNLNILIDSLKFYNSSEKPSIDDLVDTLSNHVFLDRKSNGEIGLVNDFIFGFLIADNLVKGKFQQHYMRTFTNVISEEVALKSLSSFHAKDKESKKLLWEIYNNNDFNYSNEFYFLLDYILLKEVKRDYQIVYIENIKIYNLKTNNNYSFNQCIFSDVTFFSCHFNLELFTNCTFQNCKFYNCNFDESKEFNFTDFGLLGCDDDNGFIIKIEDLNNKLNEDKNNDYNYEEDFLMLFLKQILTEGNNKPKAKKISKLKETISNSKWKEIYKELNKFISDGFIIIKNDRVHITKKGSTYFKQILL